ncbi:MAG: DUF2752 domain-containing protein [Eubacteriales bacterium]
MSEKMYSIINVALIKKDLKQVLPVGIFLLALLAIMQFIFGTTCIFVILTGIPCPACGLTRAGLCVLTLQWEQAIQYNWFIFPIAITVGIALLYRYVIGKEMAGLRWIFLVIILGMVGYYVYRMILYYPEVEPVVYHYHNVYTYVRKVVWK